MELVLVTVSKIPLSAGSLSIKFLPVAVQHIMSPAFHIGPQPSSQLMVRGGKATLFFLYLRWRCEDLKSAFSLRIFIYVTLLFCFRCD